MDREFGMKAVLLGPHPRNGSISTINYFNFHASRLPSSLPDWELKPLCPGNMERACAGAARTGMTRWENFVLWPMRLTRVRGDLLHIIDQGLVWYSAFLGPGRRLVTVHDLIAYMTGKGLLDLNAIPPRRRLLLWECIRQIRNSNHIVSVSECTAGHLVSLLGIPASKITVVPNVVDNDLYPLSCDERIEARRRWFQDAEYVVIHLGKASAYKNRIGALRAFDQLYKTLREARMFLVHGSSTSEEAAFLSDCGSRGAIQFLPPIARSELREFYGAADVLIFPSLYEGFGWPPLEAMACGCPVVCTTRGSLKEVVGDAALTVEDPYDHSSLAGALRVALMDAAAARDLRTRGFARVKNFAPENLLAQMADVYRMTCGSMR
jgi:glycosyltransferase involved in cell wall biosynthesis